ncbi:hypothetical protein ABZ897_17205 [Nonomuraea sp. NPDC046802]|uniref:hypothetical protein n=1 Tax=Nonomuraea sp. NPDC046802 TaxID=3154919 RepID=UPI0033F395A8
MSHAPERGTPPPELELPRDFPGLDGDDGGGPSVDHGEVRRAIRELRAGITALRGSTLPGMSATWTGPGTVNEVSYRGNVGREQAGSWEAADAFGGNIEQAYAVFGPSYERLMEYVEDWADAVEQAIFNYEKGQQYSSA